MERIDERSRRWPDFQGGRPIELPGGQTWWFYEPESAQWPTGTGWTFGEDVDPKVDHELSLRFSRIIAKWRRATSDADRACVVLEAAWFLLARNYNVTPENFESILNQADPSGSASLGVELRSLVDEACNRAIDRSREVTSG